MALDKLVAICKVLQQSRWCERKSTPLAKNLLYFIIGNDCYAGSFKLALWQYGS